MKRNPIIDTDSRDKLLEHKQRVAFHEAGHAAGIHLNNKARQLPPVFFKIVFKDMDGISEADPAGYDECIASIEGGRLIDSLPTTAEGHPAFEADVINLLIGPLTEAKYVAETDGELFNHKLVNLNALDSYGGRFDLSLVNDYLQSYSADKQQKDKKLTELFNAAFNFINNDTNWAAITKLAEYILGSNKNTISCEEIFSTLDQSVDHFQQRQSMAGLYPKNRS